MRVPGQHPHTPRRYLWPLLAGVAALVIVLAWSFARAPRVDSPMADEASAAAGPPWRYGRLDARFTLIEYADLECPYCQAYFPELSECLANARPDAVIRAQIEKAALAGINATPMLRVIDNHTGRALLLPGAVEGDALLSAIGLLASSSDDPAVAETLPEIPEMPADTVSDMPR